MAIKTPQDEFLQEEKSNQGNVGVLKSPSVEAIDKKYDVNQWLKEPEKHGLSPVYSTQELVHLLESDQTTDIEARILGFDQDKKIVSTAMGKKRFLESYRRTEERKRRFREGIDSFLTDDNTTSNSGLVGDDFIPLMGGPFFKQLYLRDMLMAHQLSFWAYHHDPIARAFIHIIRDFCLGRGYGIDSENPLALSIWKAFEKASNFDEQLESLTIESSCYGEVMCWWLPDRATKLEFKVTPQGEIKRALIPRLRLMDPSSCWEIVTRPEDITDVYYYQFVFPTQYQIYTQGEKQGPIAGSRFIMQQIPAQNSDGSAQMRHFKLNSMSNEKRGRSDLFPALGYLKRLRDSVNYSIIGMQKATAWAIDTTIEGSQSDVDNYIQAMQSMGTIPPAGSEFAHTAKIKREYLSNQGADKGGNNTAFEWCLNMACATVQIPVSYLGTHLSGGTTRASALVATEPVAKKFQQRQEFLRKVVSVIWSDLMAKCDPDGRLGIKYAAVEVTFPEIIVQDRSQKLKDLILTEDAGYISHERAAQMAAKELEISEYDYDLEKKKIDRENAESPPERAPMISPLLAPAAAPSTGPGEPKPEDTAVTQKSRADLKMGMGA